MWPAAPSAEPLCAVLEVFLAELPFLPEPLKGYQALQVFLELKPASPGPNYDPGSSLPEYADGAFHVELHKTVQGHETTTQGILLDSVDLRWEQIDTHPGYPDDLDIVPDEVRDAFDALPRSSELAADKLSHVLGPHIGGWPYWLTGGDVGEFTMQLDGELIGVELGFDGQLYFGLVDGEWQMLWEIG